MKEISNTIEIVPIVALQMLVSVESVLFLYLINGNLRCFICFLGYDYNRPQYLEDYPPDHRTNSRSSDYYNRFSYDNNARR